MYNDVMTYDTLDEQLVNALIGSGRDSLRSLSDDLDVSVTTVSNHLNELTESGSIQSFAPVVNYAQFGYDVTGMIQLKIDGQALQSFVDTLVDHDQIVTVYETTGDYDVVAIGKFKDTDDMNAQVKKLLDDSAVEETNTSVVLNAAKENEQFELPVEE